MELEFDKEIDSLLRRADREVIVGKGPGGALGPHLDADELVAFVENIVPERKRPLYMSHLADCDRCRGILSGLITLSADAESVEGRLVAPAVPVKAAVEPWYRRLLFPNLAYVMGGLVLIFGGLIAISLLRSSQLEEGTAVSQAVEQDSARGPMVSEPTESIYSMNSNAASAVANTASTVSTNRAPGLAANPANASSNTVANSLDKRADTVPADKKAKVSTDGASLSGATVPAPAAPPPPRAEAEDLLAMKPGVLRDEDRKVEERKKDDAEEKAVGSLSARQAQAKEVARTQAGGVVKSTPGPSRERQQNFPNRADNTFDMNEQKRVGGKGFHLRNGVWYDNTYRGQATINIRRNTDDYRKLDGDLRKIAESIDGVVVVVWKSKAYRIQ